MCKIRWNSLKKDFAQASLLLIDPDSKVTDDYRGSGKLIEYRDYSPTMLNPPKDCVPTI